jgi:hypothetical protein
MALTMNHYAGAYFWTREAEWFNALLTVHLDIKGGAKGTHFFQVIVTLFIFNIKTLCQHQNTL